MSGEGAGNATLDDELRHFLTSPPEGASRVRVARFRKHTVGSRAAAIVDDLLLGEDNAEGPDAPPGLGFTWLSPEGQALAERVRHPCDPALEDAALVVLVESARRVGAEIDIVARHRSLTARPKTVDRLVWVGGADHAPSTSGESGYRDSAEGRVSEELLSPLRDAGFEILSPSRREFAVRCEVTHERHLAWLLFLPLIALFAPVFIVLERGFGGVFRMLRETSQRALQTRRETLALSVSEGALRASHDVRPGAEVVAELPLRDIRALGFAPRAFVYSDADPGRLRALLDRGVVTLPHVVAVSGERDATRSAERSRNVGLALRAILVDLARP